MELFWLVVIFSLVGGVVSAALAALLLVNNNWTKTLSLHLLGFAAGAILATAFFELLPEAAEAILERDGSIGNMFFYTFLGLLVFFVIEGILFHLHHHHTGSFEDQPDDTHTTHAASLLVLGDSVHNFLDGIAIGATFLVSPTVGISTTLAIAVHEIPQEIGDFSIMLHAGWSKSKAIFWNIVPSLLTLIGAVLTFISGNILEPILGELIAFTAGFFIYLATADLIPELYHSTRRQKINKTFPPFFAGILVIVLLTRFLAE